MTASSYLVRVHRLFGDGYWTPLTLGRAETFADAKELALSYMQRLHREGRSRTEELAAIAGVAPYADDLLVRLVRTRSEFGLRSVAHRDDDEVTVVYERSDGDARSAAATGRQCRCLARALGGDGTTAGEDDPASVVRSTGDETAVYVAPTGDPAVGTLLTFDPETRLVLPDLLGDLGALLARRQGSADRTDHDDDRYRSTPATSSEPTAPSSQ